MYAIDKEKIFWRKVEGETVLLNIDSGFYYTLNELGSDVWDMIISGKDDEQISLRLSEEYDEREDIIRKDIKSLVKNLQKEEIIEVK